MSATSPLPLINAFLAYLTDERHFSPYTARCYGADLRQFVDFLSDELSITVDDAAERKAFDLQQAEAARNQGQAPKVAGSIGPGSTITSVLCTIDPDLIRKYLAHLGDQQYSPATMARKIATLRSFYKWAERRAFVPRNPMTLIRTPRQNKRLPKAITIEQIELLLSAPDDKDVLGGRDRRDPRDPLLHRYPNLRTRRPRDRGPRRDRRGPARPRQGQEGAHRPPRHPRAQLHPRLRPPPPQRPPLRRRLGRGPQVPPALRE